MRKDIISAWAVKNNIIVTEAQMAQLEKFQQCVLSANEKINLTTITDPADFAVKHFIDSMTLLPYIPQNATLADIGTGAGFPGIVLRVLRDDIHITLLDSRNKRIEFLRQTLDELNLQNTETLHARAEEWARTGARYDICTARAVAPMDKLAKSALPLLIKPGGVLLAMKSANISEELEKAKPALEKKGGIIEKIDTIEIAEGIIRSIVVVRC